MTQCIMQGFEGRHKATTVYLLHNLEEKVRSHRAATTSKRPDKDLAHIIPDTRLSRSRTTRYCLTLDHINMMFVWRDSSQFKNENRHINSKMSIIISLH